MHKYPQSTKKEKEKFYRIAWLINRILYISGGSSANYRETLPAKHPRRTTTKRRDNALTVYIMHIWDAHTDIDSRRYTSGYTSLVYACINDGNKLKKLRRVVFQPLRRLTRKHCETCANLPANESMPIFKINDSFYPSKSSTSRNSRTKELNNLLSKLQKAELTVNNCSFYSSNNLFIQN